MKVSVLSVPDCPNRSVVLERLTAAIEAAGASVVIEDLVVENDDQARQFRMSGSPTVLIDGVDPFAEPETEPSLSCRLYRTPSGISGAPAVGDLVSAIQRRSAASKPG